MLFGSGRVPEQLRAELAGEPAVLLENGLRGSVTYRDYRTPHQFSSLRKQGTYGAIAITATRLLVWAGGRKHIDVPLSHPDRADIEISADRPDRICFAYDAGASDPTRSGRVEIRLCTAQAGHIVQLAA
ncbi:hypothetical protein [Dactylosporangium salmoneum]|uniref:Uncharacterized protein n=1 Tax=Dactylosporangium salmoneum TaxID=53361 RepID=A0ABP5UL95_9ACTN